MFVFLYISPPTPEESVRYYLMCLSTYCDNQNYPLYFQNIAFDDNVNCLLRPISVGHCGMMGFFEFLYPPWDFLTSSSGVKPKCIGDFSESVRSLSSIE